MSSQRQTPTTASDTQSPETKPRLDASDEETMDTTPSGSETEIEYLNVYTVTRHYGGPEEGGWWYNVGEPLASAKLDIFTKLGLTREQAIQKFEEAYADHKFGDIYSVRGGVDVEIRIETHEAQYWPEERPTYC